MMERLTKRREDEKGVMLDPAHTRVIQAIDRLAYYEDMEEQGRLVVLPCKIDEPIYTIHAEKKKHKPIEYRVAQCHIDHFTIGGALIPMITACTEDNEWDELIDGTQVGHEYFLTREEAENALRGGDV